MKIKIGFVILSVLCFGNVFSQSTNAPLNKDYYHLLDRLEIKSGAVSPTFHSAVKAYPRKAIIEFIDTLSEGNNFSSRDRFNVEYLLNDNWEWADTVNNKSKRPIFKKFYKVKSDLYKVRTKDKSFDLHVNPVMYWSYGRETGSDQSTYINTRGIQLRGQIDNKLGFYSFLGENQVRFPSYVRNYVNSNGVVPSEGFWKQYKNSGYDFFTARGYISFNATKHVNLQFGHDKFFIGDGHRSILHSDFSPPALFLKVNTRVWKINYTNLFSQVFADARGLSGGSIDYPRKYLVNHRLGINITKNFNFGLFEAVVFGREDSIGNNHVELQYLNPIIFYRAVEHQNGSTDNALVGADFKWNMFKHISLYGQWLFDELKLSELKSGNGWWANKYAYQAGIKYIDVLNVDNLDIQLEYNTVRPYTYSHRTMYANYAHYRQPISHVLGANFKEAIGIVRYQPFNKLNLTAKIIYANYGMDTNNTNWGKNILKNYNTREQTYGNYTGQGVATSLLFADFTTTYQFKHNAFFDLKLIYRDQSSELVVFDQNTLHYSIAFRWNVAQRLQEF